MINKSKINFESLPCNSKFVIFEHFKRGELFWASVIMKSLLWKLFSLSVKVGCSVNQLLALIDY